MPGGRFTEKDDRMAEHVAQSYPGKSAEEAESIGYATAMKRKMKKKGRKGKPWPVNKKGKADAS